MKTSLMINNHWKTLGWILLVPSFIAGCILSILGMDSLGIHTNVFAIASDSFGGEESYFNLIETEITLTLIGVLFIIGGLLVSFSKEKIEDEFIVQTRLNSLLWAVLINYLLLLFAFLFFYGIIFFQIVQYSIFTVLIIFILRFHYLLYHYNKTNTHEK